MNNSNVFYSIQSILGAIAMSTMRLNWYDVVLMVHAVDTVATQNLYSRHSVVPLRWKFTLRHFLLLAVLTSSFKFLHISNKTKYKK